MFNNLSWFISGFNTIILSLNCFVSQKGLLLICIKNFSIILSRIAYRGNCTAESHSVLNLEYS